MFRYQEDITFFHKLNSRRHLIKFHNDFNRNPTLFFQKNILNLIFNMPMSIEPSKIVVLNSRPLNGSKWELRILDLIWMLLRLNAQDMFIFNLVNIAKLLYIKLSYHEFRLIFLYKFALGTKILLKPTK